ncbi:MAG: sodium:solute symporter [Saprospiraceae bacterium]|nr:sodium:solute symporter [Saprospiraceae bacterium]HMW38953.1 sodium:solute symporter [Saprospiraceae bacterium]HMX87085.1 sodium:solute symporter [Saprospiraceae bacterium]HMZ38835.1 sodium:solute symporter [Saprospiraceae bacterium]HNA63144.1 sodium:solute symporter [Saprospiraceae bacterium]
MGILDWLVLSLTLSLIAIYGWWKTRAQDGIRDYLLGQQDQRWWQVGLAVMATQASAITFISTTGQGYSDGLRFIQFYFGLPLAMIIICVWFIPAFYKVNVYTAYEYLEKRFDLRTRIFAASVFLLQRGLAAGITLYAPSIILSSVMGWDLRLTHVSCGILVVMYTVSGGSRAVSVTQIQQMAVIFIGMVIALGVMIVHMPVGWDLNKSLHLAGAMGKVNPLDFSFNLKERYNLWSGLTGGLFVALAYFGTDQSQVQRYLTGKNIAQSRMGLVYNGLLKIPMQFFILITGVLLFVFMQFQGVPLSYNKNVEKELRQRAPDDFKRLSEQNLEINRVKSELLNQFTPEKLTQLSELNSRQQTTRIEAAQIVKKNSPDFETNDKDYIFLHYIINFLPEGLVGLLIAVIFCAAMSSIAAELNALAGTTYVDFYKRLSGRSVKIQHELLLMRSITVFWGIVALSFAFYASLFDNLIQMINILGSVFYGSVLGIFLVAFLLKKIKGVSVFPAACLAQILVFVLYFYTDIGFLWYNVAGVCAVIFFSIVIHFLRRSAD